MIDVITRQAQLAPLITRKFSASPSLSSSASPSSSSLSSSASPSSSSLSSSTSPASSSAFYSFSATSAESLLRLSKRLIKKTHFSTWPAQPLFLTARKASPISASSTSPASTSLGYSTSSLSSFACNSFSATSAAFFAKSSSTRFSHYIINKYYNIIGENGLIKSWFYSIVADCVAIIRGYNSDRFPGLLPVSGLPLKG